MDGGAGKPTVHPVLPIALPVPQSDGIRESAAPWRTYFRVQHQYHVSRTLRTGTPLPVPCIISLFVFITEWVRFAFVVS